MNRFKNYLEAQKLSKMQVTEALAQNAKGKPDNAIRHLSEALLSQIVATNNIASLFFERRKKR